LKDFYSVLKDADPYLKLVFLTGVSRFSKVTIFIGLNQLQDITLNKEFSTVCGYTQSELESVFEDRLKDFDKEKIKQWYNGYSWLGESVYNPFDILLLFSEKRFRAFWFETGTPTFLIKMFMKNHYYIPELENLEVGDEILSNLGVDNIRIKLSQWAKKLGISYRTAWRMYQNGQIPNAVKLPKGSIIVLEDECENKSIVEENNTVAI